MSQFDKLIERVRAADRALRFEELEKVLAACGYTCSMPRGGSSHCTFRKPGCAPLTIPRHRPIGIVYIKMVRAVVEKELQDE